MTGLRKPGLLDELAQAAQNLVDSFRPTFEAIFGMRFEESERVRPGEVFRVGNAVIVHPVTGLIFGGRYPATVHGELDASLEWQLRKIDRAAERAVARIEGMYR